MSWDVIFSLDTIFFPRDVIYFVKCTSPSFSKATPQHDASIHILHSWEGVETGKHHSDPDLTVFPGWGVAMAFFTSSLMTAHSQEVGLQLIDWPSQIRAELHEPINVCDSSGPAGLLRLNHIVCFHSWFYISQCLYSPSRPHFTPLSKSLISWLWIGKVAMWHLRA